MTLLSLMDDYCPKRGLRGEHGLSLYIEMDRTKILFDTGQGASFLDNARFLGVALASLDAVILSHGHYDHGGGLSALYEHLRQSPPLPPLFAGRGFDRLRKSKGPEGLKDIGLSLPATPEDFPVPIIVDSLRQLAPRIHILPPAERLDGSEPNPRFRRMEGETDLVDAFTDELSLVIDEDGGIVVVTGCAHRGIVNIVRAALRAFPGRPVRAIIGGFHLVDASPDAAARIARELADTGPHALYCSHCTGLIGFSALHQALRGKVAWLSCGMSLSL